MKTAAQKIKKFSADELADLQELRALRTEIPATRADCESQTDTPCTAFGCKFNLTTEIAFRKPSKALEIIMQGIQDKARNNCLLDLVEDNRTYDIVEIAERLLMTQAKAEAVLRVSMNKYSRMIPPAFHRSSLHDSLDEI